MSKLLILITMMSIAACSFKNDDKNNTSPARDERRIGELSPDELKKMDSDGDFISDFDELEKGLNPLIANIPEIKLNFSKAYTVKIKVKDLASNEIIDLKIEQAVDENDPDFQFKTGRIYDRDYIHQVSARNGKYSSYTVGEINKINLNKISYPEISSNKLHSWRLKYLQYFNTKKYEIIESEILIKNSLSFKKPSNIAMIKNLKLGIKYWDFKEDQFKEIHEEVMTDHFETGAFNEFDLKITNPPVDFFKHSLFKKGKFLVAEVKDYEIPSLDVTFKTLSDSVLRKTTPVIHDSPLATDIYWVATSRRYKDFTEILKLIFDDNMRVEDEKLTKVIAFENNLPDFEYLSEVKELKKKGKWFVLTNSLNHHYLSHKFTPKDVIAISYITGDVLSSQIENNRSGLNRIFSEASSSTTSIKKKLGKVLKNSQVELAFKGVYKKGTNVKTDGPLWYREDRYLKVYCEWEVNTLHDYEGAWDISKKLNDDIESVWLNINDKSFKITDLIANKQVDSSFQNHILTVKINDFKKIDESFDELSTFDIGLEFFPTSKTVFVGSRLYKQEGKHWQSCAGVHLQYFLGNNPHVPVSTRSLPNIQFYQPWQSRGLKIAPDETIENSYKIDVSSKLINYFN